MNGASLPTTATLVPVSLPSVNDTAPTAAVVNCLQLGAWWGQAAATGGLNRVFTDLVEHLPSQGVNVTGLVEGPDDVAVLTSGRIRNFAPSGASMPRRYVGVRRRVGEVLQTEAVGVVASHFALYAALVLDKLRGKPFVAHFHGPWSGEAAAEGGRSWVVEIKRRTEGRVLRRADRIIVLSRAFQDLVVRNFDVPAERVRIVAGHVDLTRFARSESRLEARLRLDLPTDRPIVLTVRRLWQRMGLDRLITALGDVTRRVPEALLCIGGTGKLRATLEAQVAMAGLQRSVRFLGYVPEDDLPLLYRAADLTVMPTVALEGFGLVAAESISAGTPCLVTPMGGLPEVVGPLSQDLIMRSSEAVDIADAITQALLGHCVLPDDAACRRYAGDNFSVSLAAARTAAVYREIAQ